MLITRVRVDGQSFFLSPEQDVEATKEAIVAAVRDGSGFVDFLTVGHGRVSVLITPSIPVRFQVIERTVEELEHLETEPPPLDEAHWLEHGL
jgi:hypothetical protein